MHHGTSSKRSEKDNQRLKTNNVATFSILGREKDIEFMKPIRYKQEET